VSNSVEESSRLTPDWRRIAKQASTEADPKKLIELAKAVCDRFQAWQEANQQVSKPRIRNANRV
jgi:hypothetical protein